MARIRSIKPEFWSSPGVATLDPHARLLYIAMWNWADDNGVGVANPRELLGFAFPLDDDITVVELRRWLVDIRRVFDVEFYSVSGRQYFAIPSWEDHQKFDRRSKGKYPGPEEADLPSDLGDKAPSTESHESPPSDRRDSVAGTGEQGNRGTGEQSLVQPPVEPKSPYSDAFEAWWKHYPRRESKGDAFKAWESLRKSRVLPEMDVLTSAADSYARRVTDATFRKLPAGWLRDHKWLDESNTVKPVGQKVQTVEQLRAKREAVMNRGA